MTDNFDGWTREKIEWRSQLGYFVGRVRYRDGKRSAWTKLAREKTAAERAYDRWLRTGETPGAELGSQTFAQYAAELAKLEAGTDKGKDRQARLRDFALPEIGMQRVAELGANHVLGVLKKMAEQGYSASTVDHMRVDISKVLQLVKDEGVILVNVAKSLTLPANATVDTRTRMGLTDEQHLRFHQVHGYEHPVAMAVLFCRRIAGHRTSDINAADWEHVDTVEFATMHVRRPKTDGEVGAMTKMEKARKVRAYEMVTHEVDESVRPLIRAYWLSQGSPTVGPIFPMLRDGRGGTLKLSDGRVVERKAGKAGERRGDGSSFAASLRRMVWEAGIYVPNPKMKWDPERPDKAKCLLQTDTKTTKRLDFHGIRAALVTAVAGQQGVSLATQLGITGHNQPSTQLKHYMRKRTVRVPKGALPGQLEAPAAPVSPVAPAPVTTATEHQLLAAMAALSAQVAALTAAPAPAAAGADPHSSGMKRTKAALRVVR